MPNELFLLIFNPCRFEMARPNSIFQKIKQGLFTFTPAHFEPRAPGLGPVFGPGRIAVLRRKLWLEGIDPATVGLPSAAESEPTRILKKPGPNRMTIAK